MVHSVGDRRNKITGILTVRLREGGGDMGGGAVWGQSDGRTYVTCMVHSVGVRRNKITL